MIEETYRIKAIVLKRQPFREHDLLITAYSPEKGKQALIARGARKFRSKIAAHVEPFCFIDCMVVRGKTHDYMGSALSSNCLVGIKSDFDRVEAASRVCRFFDKTIKEGQPDITLFVELRDILALIDGVQHAEDAALWADLSIFRLLSRTGYEPDLHRCVFCGSKPDAEGIMLDQAKNGIVCQRCAGQAKGLTISENAVKLLRLANELEISRFRNLKVDRSLALEISLITTRLMEQ
ncbi:DNA repair protein RecO [Candidatus Falkowbacteria bacterium]|nr:DNA repair protein RecO [Candidatus Falkowbacteria bacterium]